MIQTILYRTLVFMSVVNAILLGTSIGEHAFPH